MRKTIVLHDRFSNEPIVIRASAINAVRKAFDRTENIAEEYSEILISVGFIGVAETIGTVITKIKKAEGGAVRHVVRQAHNHHIHYRHDPDDGGLRCFGMHKEDRQRQQR